MALYQFPITLIPNDFKGEKLSENVWSGSKFNNERFVNELIAKLKETFDYKQDVLPRCITFGKDKGIKIDVLTDKQGLLEDVFIRIHVKYLDDTLQDIKKLENILSNCEVQGWTGNNSKIDFKLDIILYEIKESTAFKFVKDPITFLEEMKKYKNNEHE